MPAPGPDLRAALAARLPAGIGIGVCAVGDALPDPREAAGIAAAHPRRRATFAAGRAAARQALGQDAALPMGPDRLPVWPPGWRGSISHTDRLAACIARRGDAALALDIEATGRVRHDLWPTLFARAEAAAPGFDATIAFAGKEALFKLLHPLAQVWFGFHAALATVGAGEVTLRLLQPVGPFAQGFAVTGPAVQGDGHTAVALWL